MKGPIGVLINNCGLVRQLTRRAIASQFKGSVLGVVWVFARPLLVLSVYTVVFGVIWPRDDDGFPLGAYAAYMFGGLCVYNLFASALMSACTSVVTCANLVKQVVFPLEVLPFVQVLSQIVMGCAWFLLYCVGSLVVYGSLPFTTLLLPLPLVPLVLITAGAAWFVASLTVYIRDLKQFMPVFLQLLFFVTPIFWQIDELNGHKARLQPYLFLNPLTGAAEAVRDVVLRGRQPDWLMLGWLTIAGVAVFYIGFAWFVKTKKGFADVM